jgi:hypothetical protein
MRIILFFILVLISNHSNASSCSPPTCAPGQLLYSKPLNGLMGNGCLQCVNSCPVGTYPVRFPTGLHCRSDFPSTAQDCYQCQLYNYQQQPMMNPYFNMQYPWMMNTQMPWWAIQGNYYYPNFNYPGSWYNHGMNPQHYPGNNHTYAAKPNIYVKNEILKLTKFSWKFKEKEKAEFLATTPALTNYGWEGLVSGESFLVKNVGYSYLFYDARMDHKKMQFDHGICLEKENLIPEMLTDLQKKSYPEEALKDFQEHWAQKIPNYPYYCVYPQYNQQLDSAMPIEVTPSDAVLTRVLYIVVPHTNAPKLSADKFPSLPTKSPASLMPALPAIKEKKIHFLEWGVAFLDGNLTK